VRRNCTAFRRLHQLKCLLGNSFDNFYAVHPFSRYKFLIEILSLLNAWLGGIAVGINRSWVRIPAAPLLSATLGKFLTHRCAYVTEQYNLVPANGRWCLAAGKVTIGLASHWPCVTDISGSPPTGSRLGRGRWAPPYALLWSMVDFTFTLLNSIIDSDVKMHHFWPSRLSAEYSR